MHVAKSIIFLSLLILFSSCDSETQRKSGSKDFVLASGIPIGDINPFGLRVGIGANLADLIHRPIFKINAQGELVGELATKFTWENNGLLLRVILREDRAQDVKATFESVKKLRGGDLKEGVRHVKDIHVVGPNEVMFIFDKYDRAFSLIASQLPIVSDSKSTGDFSLNALSESEVSFYRKQPSAYHVNRIIVKSIPSPRRAIRELVAGNVDFLFLAHQGDYNVLRDLPDVAIGEISTKMLYLVLENKVTSKREIDWKYLNNTIDKKSIIQELGQGGLEIAYLPDSPESAKNKPVILEDNPEANVRSSNKPPRVLSFLGKQAVDRKLARILKRKFESVGFPIELKVLSPQEFEKEVIVARSFDLLLLPFNIKDPLVSNYLIFHSSGKEQGLNWSGYSNSAVDINLDAARYSFDAKNAQISFEKAMQAMADDPPGLFLFWLKIPIVYRQSCTGFKFSSNEFFSSLKDVRCEPSAAN